jgi:hypothetical protein
MIVAVMKTLRIYILIPVLLHELKSDNSCFSQVIRLCYDINTQEVKICQGYDEIEVNCDVEKNRFIIYYVDLIFLKNGSVNGRHSEAILVDTLFRTIEFFEPNGPVASWYDVVNSYFEYYFAEIFPDYKYLSTGEFCPSKGPQAKASLPVCGAFSLLFLLLRIKNEELTSGEVIGHLINLSKSELEQLLYQFIYYINNYARIHRLILIQNLYDRILNQIDQDPDVREIFDALYLKLDIDGLIATSKLYGLDLVD